jgi:hypothetical protein
MMKMVFITLMTAILTQLTTVAVMVIFGLRVGAGVARHVILEKILKK